MNGNDFGSGDRQSAAWTATIIAVVAMAPITLFVASAVGRLLQPLPNQPAGIEQHIFDWFVALPAAGLTVLLVALPVIGMLSATTVLWRCWRSDAALRADARLAAALLVRIARRPLVWVSAGVLLLGTLLGLAAITHGITPLTG
jgi:hypothetical protein